MHYYIEAVPLLLQLPVLVGTCDGFVGNRMYSRYGTEVSLLLVVYNSVVLILHMDIVRVKHGARDVHN